MDVVHTNPADRPVGSLHPDPAGGFVVVTADGSLAPHQVPTEQAAELTALLALRDTLGALQQAATDPRRTEEATALRRRLNNLYDAYTDEWGALNRITVRRTNWIEVSRTRPAQGGFAADPAAADVYALEKFHESRNFGTKTAIFDEPTATPTDPVRTLERWEEFGATWRVVHRTPGTVTIALCRCDGGEEAQRLTSNSPALFRWLAGRTSSTAPGAD